MKQYKFYYNLRKGKWQLVQLPDDTVLYNFPRKSAATRRGILRKILGPEGGDVQIYKMNGEYERTQIYTWKVELERRQFS